MTKQQVDLSSTAQLNIKLHPVQTLAFQTKATEILYGGAAGGGKSFLARAMAIIWATLVPGLQIYLFRRIRPDLIKNHVEGPKGFTNLLAPWLRSGLVRIVGNEEIRFWNGSKIYLCHCQHSKDIYRYQGAEIHLLLLEEATQFTPEMVNFLRTRVRVIGLDIPAQYKDMFPRIYYLTNPGNVGHSYFKENFVDKGPYEIWRARKDEGETIVTG